MKRWMKVLACVAAVGITACGGDKSGPTEPKEDTTPTPKTDIKSPEDARRELGELNIEYSRESFIKAVENEDVLAVALFIDAGMDPNTKNNQGEPVLLWALKNGKSSVVDVFLKRKVGLNAQDRDEETALMWAVQASRPDVVERLIENGANLNLRDDNGRTALTYAVTKNDTTGLKLLLGAKADANADSGQALTIAISRGDLDFVGTLLEAGANPSVRYENDDESDGEWPLVTAARLEDEVVRSEMVRILLQAGADVTTEAGASALLAAVEENYEGTVRRLLEAGVDVTPCYGSECKSEAQREIGTAITMAVAHNDTAMVKLLLGAGADVNAFGPNVNTGSVGDRPLTIAADTHGDAEMVRLLLDAGADINLPDISRRTALWHAASRGNLEIVQFLVQAGANLDIRDAFGVTPVMRAVESRADEVFQFLLASGADVTAEDWEAIGPTRLLSAAQSGDKDLLRMLIEAGADLNAQSEDGQTSLLVAIESENPAVIQMLIDAGARVDEGILFYLSLTSSTDILSVLIDAGVDVNTRDSGGTTPLMVAAQTGQVPAAILLLELGANIDLTDTNGRTALWHATDRGQLATVQMLVDSGANLNIRDASGVTPVRRAAQDREEIFYFLLTAGTEVLAQDIAIVPAAFIFAAQSGNKGLVNMLLEVGADVNAQFNRQTPLQAAIDGGHAEIVQILIDAGAIVDGSISYYLSLTRNPEVLSVLVGAGVDVNARKGQYNNTELELAVSNNNKDLVRLLLYIGANVNAQHPATEGTALIMAASAIRENVQIVRLLVDGGADVNARDKYGATAIMGAASRGHLEIVKVLVEAGADVNAQYLVSISYRRALWFALNGGHTAVADYLREHGATE